mgnify:CR=1 FL=1
MRHENEEGDSFSQRKDDFFLELEKLSYRKINSLAFFYNRYSIKNYKYCYKKINSRCFIDRAKVDGKYYEVEKSLELMESRFFIEEDYFEWLYEDLRAQIFVFLYIRSLLQLEIDNKNKFGSKDVLGYLYPPEYSDIVINEKGSIVEFIYELFDFYIIDDLFQEKNKKIKIMERARLLWSDLYNQCTYTDWVENASDHQVRWLKKYLEDKGVYISDIQGISSTKYFHSVLLASLDFIDIEPFIQENKKYKDSESKNKFIDRMRKSWSQKVHRDSGRAKKKYHLPLAVTTKDRLSKISMVEGVSESDILERLINEEYGLKYLDVNGQDKY